MLIGPAVGWGAALVFTLMTVLWLGQLRTRNAGVVDVGWAASIGLLAVWYAAVSPSAIAPRLLVAILGGVWGLRLSKHLFDRVVGHPEEGRYEDLREKWGAHADRAFLLFFWAQAALAVWLSTPFLLAAYRPEPGITGWGVAGTVLCGIGITGEAVADRQLARFKSNASNRGRTCREGLWRVSRHPNYFFEWIVWCGFATAALGRPWGWLGLIGPATILLFLLKITGIPPTEAQSLRSRGDEYREYQRTTSAFFPWFPKRSER